MSRDERFVVLGEVAYYGAKAVWQAAQSSRSMSESARRVAYSCTVTL
jgi:hypothetical protein